MASILSATAVVKRFGGLVAVDHVDLEVEERSIHAIIGPNGAGKTTFFNCVTGFYIIDGGRVIFDEKPLMDVPPDQITRRGISRTYQNIRLFANMTAIENLLVGQERHLKDHPVPDMRNKGRMKKHDGCSILWACEAKGTFLPRIYHTATSDVWKSVGLWPVSQCCSCSTSRLRG